MGLCGVGERIWALAILVKGDGLSVLKRDDEVLESHRKLMGSCSLVERSWGLATLEKVLSMRPCIFGEKNWKLAVVH